MAKPTIDNIRDLTYATAYQWNLRIQSPPPALAGKVAFSTDVINDFNIRCLSAELPKTTNQKHVIETRGLKVHQAGQNQFSNTIPLVFNETVDNKCTILIDEWAQACTNFKTGASGLKSEYSAVLILERLNTFDIPIYQYTMFSAFYEDSDPGSLDTGNELFKPSLIFSYDYYIPKNLV